ncbi:MAG TPA: DUF4142 domain-containing protein [Actinophytocola sp.]|nr:DUF4142 domain-containing protein [Actinophytocola sp.]
MLALLVSAFPAAWLAFAEQAQPTEADEFSDRDREFLFTIRYANLWEIPMGDLAVRRGNSDNVREVGRTINTDHKALNIQVEELARQFDVDLPDAPKSSHQQWMDEISAATGDEFDRIFANRLRAAHGSVFGLIAEVRAGTRNDTIREFATAANTVVMKHMTILEGTGHVTSEGLFSEASARASGNPENQLGGSDLALAGILGIFVVGATLGLVRTFSSSAHGAADR